jgi:hypothetical protein
MAYLTFVSARVIVQNGYVWLSGCKQTSLVLDNVTPTRTLQMDKPSLAPGLTIDYLSLSLIGGIFFF